MITPDIIESFIARVNAFIWSWPLIIFLLAVGILATLQLRFLQLRYFGRSWRLIFDPANREKKVGAEISPLQAFVNVLSVSMGNGSLAGMATALYSGGPGAAFWVFVVGFLALIIRFCEVYLSDMQTEKIHGTVLGGPMIYLRKVPAGNFLAYLYAFFLVLLAFFMGSSMQTNSIRVGIEAMTGISPYFVAGGVALFMSYLLIGGAKRILKVSDIIVPFKVGLFFISAAYVVLYHWRSIIPALKLMVTGAFNPQAIVGGVMGYSVLSALRFGIARSSNATEAGLGTASVLFGSTGRQRPLESGLIGMVSTFVSQYLVCFVLMLIIIASGVWNNGQTSTALTISAFQTAFGTWGGWIVASLSVIFGMGVLVSYAFLGREAWKFLTGGRWLALYSLFYGLFAVGGTLAKVGIVWEFADFINAGLMAINLFAILWLLPEIKRGVQAYERRGKSRS